MNKTISFTFALALILGGLTTTAAQAKWFGSIGFGVALHNGDAAQVEHQGITRFIGVVDFVAEVEGVDGVAEGDTITPMVVSRTANQNDVDRGVMVAGSVVTVGQTIPAVPAVIAGLDDVVEEVEEVEGVDAVEGTPIRGSFQSDPGLAFNVDIGFSYRDMFRFGAFAMNTSVLEKKFGSRTIADDVDLRGGEVFNFTLIQSNILTVGGFTGVQFELGGGTPTRHYLYADYGLGFHYQVAGVKQFEHYDVSTFSHMFRAGVNVPEVFQSFGTGMELLWTFPDSGDAARTFSILAKASYTF